MRKIKKESLTERAIKEIKNYLLSGKIKEGDKIPTEAELSERLGVGRSTVREATRTLATMGYIELKPGRGAFAAITSKESEREKAKFGISWFEANAVKIYEWQEARMCVEPHMCAIAAQKATEKERAALSKNIEDFAKNADSGNLEELCRLEYEFHDLLSAMTHNPLVIALYGEMRKLFKEFVTNGTYKDKTFEHTVNEHKRIADAVVGGDGYGAKKAMEEHLASSANKIPV